MADGVRRSNSIQWYDPNVPVVSPPPYAGKRYQATVPDTIDLQEMARSAVNGTTGPTDPDADYEIYWRAAFNTNPAVMWHTESDIVQCKFMEALPLLRIISGSGQNAHVEQRWMEVMLQSQGPDGLIYMPKKGRPWCGFGVYGKVPPGAHYFSPWFIGRMMGGYAIYHQLTGDTQWKKAAERVVAGVDRLLVHDDGKARFANHEYGTEGRYVSPNKPSDAVHNLATYHSWAIQGLANVGRSLGSERAIELAGKMARWVREDSGHFGPNVEYLPEYPDVSHIHFHGHTEGLLSMLDYGLAAGDQQAIAFADRGFRYGMSQGECLLGYFPEWLGESHPQTLELCELADMLGLAVKLSAAGVGDYWDMADRWTRNLFYEGQLHDRHVQPLARHGQRVASTAIDTVELPDYHQTDRVIERNIGAFGGWLAPNDWLPDQPHLGPHPAIGIMHCCTGNGVRAIYYLWEHALAWASDASHLHVNLLMNRASRQAEVLSHIPYGGRVDVVVKVPLQLSVRLPEWVVPEQASAQVDRQDRPIRMNGRYADLGRVEAGSTVTVHFPISSRTERVEVETRSYRLLLRGSTCVAIDPPGQNVPLFNRDHFLQDATPWRSTERFVADQQIAW